VRYEQPISELKEIASRSLGVPVENLQLFRHKKELTPAYDSK
jgi:hypothetical protein